MNIIKAISITALSVLSIISSAANAAPVGIKSSAYDSEHEGNTLHIFRPTVYDSGSKRIYTTRSEIKAWNFVSVGGDYFNIKSVSRPNGCIYDSSGSILAKFDRSCNRNEPRAEWKQVPSGNYVKIVNKKGRCLEIDTNRNRLKAVTCTSSTFQLFSIY